MATKTKTKRKPKATLKELNVNFKHKENICEFIQDNIAQINNNIGSFDNNACKNAKLKFDATDIKKELHDRFLHQIESDASFREELWREFEEKNFVKSKIKEIAIDTGYYHKDLEMFYRSELLSELETIADRRMSKNVIDTILNSTHYSNEKKKYIKSIIAPCIEKALYIALKNGFSLNLNNVEEGVMTANAGDSAQFLFLARAILAGYNCSNVDVRSSRYDAIIDYKTKLFKVQIKGISGTTISFKDRDRGGRGIDTENERNQGKRITLEDCDIYAAVDKQMGICYIIPMKDADPTVWPKDTMTLKEAEKYRENWNIIADLL